MSEVIPKIEPYWYLATPYSKYLEGITEAWIESCKAVSWLVRRGVPVYSPIASTHPVATHGNLDPYDHAIWLPVDKPFMDAAGGLIVLKMPGWDASYGIAEEIKVFQVAGKPIIEMEWPLK